MSICKFNDGDIIKAQAGQMRQSVGNQMARLNHPAGEMLRVPLHPNITCSFHGEFSWKDAGRHRSRSTAMAPALRFKLSLLGNERLPVHLGVRDAQQAPVQSNAALPVQIAALIGERLRRQVADREADQHL